MLTRFESFNSNGSSVVPESFPNLSKLAVAQLAKEFEGGTIDFPLISGIVRQSTGYWLFYLNTWLAEIDTETIRVFRVVLHELLKCAEGCTTGDKEASCREKLA